MVTVASLVSGSRPTPYSLVTAATAELVVSPGRRVANSVAARGVRGLEVVRDLSILGLDRAGVENYQITLGGDGTETATIGERANVKVDITGKIKTTLQMFGIAFMVWKVPLFGIPVYTIGFVLLVLAAVMTIWSMVVYLRAAWPFIMADAD